MNGRWMTLALALSASALLVTGCATVATAPAAAPTPPGQATGLGPGAQAKDAGSVGMANPAATYCLEQGYKSEIRTGADGGQQGFCIFSDGSECDEWAFYRGECKPGASAPAQAPTQAPATARTQAPEANEGGQGPSGSALRFAPGETSGQGVEGWTGTILRQEPGDQIGPYFQRDDGQRFGVGSSDAALSGQIAGLRGTGTKIKVWGKLFLGVPADQARHIEVERLETVK